MTRSIKIGGDVVVEAETGFSECKGQQGMDSSTLLRVLKCKYKDPSRTKYVALYPYFFNCYYIVSAGAETNATTVDGTRPIDYYVRKEPADWKAYAEGLDMLLQDSSINIKNLYRYE